MSFEASISKVVILIITFVLVIITSPIISSHLCHLKASLIEIPLTFITTGLCILYVYKASGKWMHTRRIFGTFLLAIVIYQGYGLWLHSDSFLTSRLNESSFNRHQQLQSAMEAMNVKT